MLTMEELGLFVYLEEQEGKQQQSEQCNVDNTEELKEEED